MPGGLYYALLVLADPTIVVPLPQYFQAASSIVSRLSTPSKSPDAMVKCDGLWTQLIEINRISYICTVRHPFAARKSMIVHGDLKGTYYFSAGIA
ncbi:hypothetical protein EVJ58_g8186 [Rhodofomes roseus]|uniref:Uncharacterized protein n=1 Tax=Rhodofomes roseus TaxID=34475 RepID=A0A4Y9Y0V4_9APHY|nr:hypothetical protein EVJ58_g8186 [Rhodofomes roseus]